MKFGPNYMSVYNTEASSDGGLLKIHKIFWDNKECGPVGQGRRAKRNLSNRSKNQIPSD